MPEFLYSIDKVLLYFFNHSLSTPFLDKFFSIITNVNNWYIAYIILLLIAFFKGGRKGKIAAVMVLVLITVTDQLGHKVLKEVVERLRPCNELDDIITPLGCQGTFSFPSNHALNNFASAMFFYILFPNLKWAFFITASLVAVSRVYLGLHYPSDILGGALIGSAFGYLFGIAALKLNDFIEIEISKKINRIMEKLLIRFAEEKDIPVILTLIKELAEYERLSSEVIATEESLRKTLFGEKKYAEILIAEYDTKPAGQAFFFHNYSTFLSKPGIYLEDLFVKPEFRGKGIGKALLLKLIEVAKERNCGRVEWAVLDWNEPAINFYKKLGAVPMNEWTVFRLTEDKF